MSNQQWSNGTSLFFAQFFLGIMIPHLSHPVFRKFTRFFLCMLDQAGVLVGGREGGMELIQWAEAMATDWVAGMRDTLYDVGVCITICSAAESICIHMNSWCKCDKCYGRSSEFQHTGPPFKTHHLPLSCSQGYSCHLHKQPDKGTHKHTPPPPGCVCVCGHLVYI